MDTNLLNNYVLKAIDAYPYDLEETVENLNYALSYESNNAYALYLMGRLQAEQLGDYEKAIKALKTAKAFGYNNGFISHIDNEISRIKDKIKPKKKIASKKKKSKKDKKKKNKK